MHGCPEQLVTDNGKQFTSQKFTDHVNAMGIRHSRTSNYHPQSNGMDERVNGSLLKIVKKYLNEDKTNWDKNLKWATYIYNTAPHESIDMSPYEAMFGCLPRTPLNLEPGNALTLPEARKVLRGDLRRNQERAANSMKMFYDRNRLASPFEVGQMVLVLNKGRIVHESRKLQPKWKGPGIIVRLPKTKEEEDPLYAEVLLFKPQPHTMTCPLSDITLYNCRSEEPEDGPIVSIINKVARVIRAMPPHDKAPFPEQNDTLDLLLDDEDEPSPVACHKSQNSPNRQPAEATQQPDQDVGPRYQGGRLSVVNQRARAVQPPAPLSFDEQAGSTPVHDPGEEGNSQALETIREEQSAPDTAAPEANRTRFPVSTSGRILRNRSTIPRPARLGMP